MHKRLFFLLCHIFLVLCATSSLAEETGIPGVLDYSVRRATITRNEFYLYAGDYYGDSLENSWLVGGEYMFHFTRHFGLGADFAYSKADFNENVFYSQAGFWTNDNVYIIDATGMINFPAAYRMGEKVIEADLYILLGGGTINLNSSYEPHGFIGGGMIPTVFAAAFTIFPPSKRSIVSPMIGLVATLAPTIGPTIGGYLTDLFSWHWLFLVNLPPGIVVAALAARYVRIGRHDGISRFTASLVEHLLPLLGADDELVALIHDDGQLDMLPAGLTVHRVSPPTSAREPWVASQVNRIRPDVVFSPMQTMGTIGRRYPLALTLHDLIYNNVGSGVPIVKPRSGLASTISQSSARRRGDRTRNAAMSNATTIASAANSRLVSARRASSGSRS